MTATEAQTCSHCGAFNDPPGRFCVGCGQALATPSAQVAHCPHCGAGLPVGSDFCPQCGAATPPAVVFRASPAPVGPIGIGPIGVGAIAWPRASGSARRRLPAAGSALVALCFFLPWVLVSCNAGLAQAEISMSGYEMATGDVADLRDIRESLSQWSQAWGSGSDAGNSSLAGSSNQPFLWLIPAMAIGGLLVFNNRNSGSVVAVITALIGIAVLALFTVNLFKDADTAQQQGFTLELRMGYWGTWLGLLWQAAWGAVTHSVPGQPTGSTSMDEARET